jgi:hypothetical protein
MDIRSYVVINIKGYDGAVCEKPAACLSPHYDFQPALAIIASKVSFLEIWVVTPIGRSWAKDDGGTCRFRKSRLPGSAARRGGDDALRHAPETALKTKAERQYRVPQSRPSVLTDLRH